MGEIRIVGPGKTRGYPYPECKKETSDANEVIVAFCILMTCAALQQLKLKGQMRRKFRAKS